jgi:predicted phage-related endonuclease
MQLYLEKLGLAQDDDREETDNQLWGQLLEEPIAAFYAVRHGVVIDSFRETLVHPEYDFLTANPDRVVVAEERLLEIKTAGLGGLEFWRDQENVDQLKVPQHVILQVNWYLGFLGWVEGDVALLHFAE